MKTLSKAQKKYEHYLLVGSLVFLNGSTRLKRGWYCEYQSSYTYISPDRQTIYPRISQVGKEMFFSSADWRTHIKCLRLSLKETHFNFSKRLQVSSATLKAWEYRKVTKPSKSAQDKIWILIQKIYFHRF